jgi:putative FmdB family regulatory protein
MPIYEYQCQACGHQLEKLQKVNDPVLVDCPHCHKPTLQKLMSATSFQLKGTGWYATDFKNPNKANASAKDRDTQDQGGKEGGGTSDTTKKESGKDSGKESDNTSKSDSSVNKTVEKATVKSTTKTDSSSTSS